MLLLPPEQRKSTQRLSHSAHAQTPLGVKTKSRFSLARREEGSKALQAVAPPPARINETGAQHSLLGPRRAARPGLPSTKLALLLRPIHRKGRPRLRAFRFSEPPLVNLHSPAFPYAL